MDLFKGFIFGLHNIEPHSYKNDCSKLFNNLTITPEFLEKLILFFKENGFNFVSMEQFLKDKLDDKEHKNIVITIDDGWKGVYQYAFPVFKKYNIPFVFYVATDLINNGFKNCKLAEMDGMNVLCDNINNIQIDLSAKQELFAKLWNKFKHKRRLFFWKNNYDIMQSFFKNKIDFEYYKNISCCSIADLNEMVNSGLCEIGSHTHNHIHMDRINKKDVVKQITESNKNIESFCGIKCKYFSYPYGHYNDFSYEKTKKYYESAVIVSPKNNKYCITKNDNVFTMPRIFIDMNIDFNEIMKKIN